MLMGARRLRAEQDALREEAKTTIAFVVEQGRRASDASSEAQQRQLDLLEKSFAQLRASNAWEYQAIMSMNGVSAAYDEAYDPSPEAEAVRIADRHSAKDELDESLSAEEAAVLGDIFPGI